MSENNVFDAFDFTLEEALAADAALISRPAERDGRVCVCGHPVARHTQVSGLTFCKPTRMECPCKSVRTVLESDDVRPFLRKTEGAGALHALGRGIAAAVSKGIKVNWVDKLVCDRCKAETKLSPVPVTQRGIAVNHATGFDALLCEECRVAV